MRYIKMYSDITSGVIRFDGSTIKPKALGSVVALENPNISNRIRIKSIFNKSNGGERRYFGKLNPLRVKNRDGVRLMQDLNYTQAQVIDYLNIEFGRTLQDLEAEYKGVWDASSNTPDVTADAEAVSGDWYFVSTAGTYNGVDYAINDQIRYSGTTWERIQDQSAKVTAIEDSARAEYDLYVDASYLSGAQTGSILKPYRTIALAVSNSSDGDKIFIKGVQEISTELALPHSLFFYGVEGSEVKYNSYDSTNGSIISHDGDSTDAFGFYGIKFSNAGEYALHTKKTTKVTIDKCIFINNGWNGLGLHTVASKDVTGILGYDSDSADLQAFYAGSNASNGGAVRIEESTQVLITGNTITNNLRGLRVQDCGINGGGVISRNQSTQNIESGIYIAAGTLGGSQNITTTMNVSAYNANNGLLVIGGLNNKFSQNEVNGNWNAGFCAWGAGNTTLRDCGLYDNNRSQYNGIGNTGDAKASIQINEAYNLLGTVISLNPAFRFIAEILDTQVHYTGLGSNTDKIGFLITSAVGDLPANDKNIIKVDDVGFIGQDYAIDFSEVDLSNLQVALGDNSYMSIGEKAVRPPGTGDYFELPFSNHITNINYADFSVDNTGNIKVLEGASGARLNPYKVNDIQAIADGTNIKIVLKDSKKVQFSVPVSGCSINGSYVNSVLNLALVQLNDLFTNTVGFASGGNPVTNFELVNNDLTLTLEDGTSYTVDVTSLGVSSDNFVVSGAISGTDLVLTMDDSSTVTIDATNMINGSSLSALGQNWFISYGANAGTQLGNPTSGNLSYNNAPIYYGDKLEVGTEFMWTQYHMITNASVFMSIGVWNGATNDVTGALSTAVSNWSTKFGFYSNRLTEDTSTFTNGGYSSKNTDIGTGATYTNGSIMRLVYGSDYRLRLYVNDVLTATTIVAESGNDLDIQLIASNNGVVFPNFIKRNSGFDIVHDFDSSETSILDGIEDDTVLKSQVEISAGEKAMINLNRDGRNLRIGVGYTGADTGNTNSYQDVTDSFVYGTSEQIIPQNTNSWSFNTSALYSFNSARWQRGSGLYAGMVSLRYHSDNSVDLYSETYGEVIATKVIDLDGSDFSVYIGAAESTSYSIIPPISKQTIGQSFQPVENYAPVVADQSINATEGDTLNYQIVSSDYIVNQYVAENAPSWMIMNQNTGVLSGVVPAYVGDASDTVVVNCKAGNAVGGVTNFIVTVSVQEFTYTNTKSLRFAAASSAYLTGNANSMNVMQRASNGSGASDAWSMSMWIRLGGNSATSTIFNYGGDSTLNDGGIVLTQQSINNLVFTYGSGANYIGFVATGVVTPNTWHHILITYDGGTTGAASGSLSDYYSRFKLVIDGNIQSPTFLQSNYGYTGSIPATNLYIGRNVFSGSNLLKYARINQMAFWDSNEFSNRAAIYNSGATQDLSSLSSAPSNYYEVENSTTTISDLIGSADLTGYNFSSSDLVTDTP